MMNKSFLTVLVVGSMLLLPLDDCWGRGFGGARLGGMGGGGARFGGMGGGGRSFGGMGGGRSFGGFPGGGARNFGGFNGGAAGGLGGLNRGGLGGGGLGGLGGGRSPGNLGGLREGLSGLPGGAGERISGLGGGAGAGRLGGGGLGAGGLGESRFNRPDRSQLNNFLGLPSDSGLNHLGTRPGAGGGGEESRGARIAAGARNDLPVVRPGAGGGGEESRGARVYAGFRNYSPSTRYNHASYIRNNFNNYNIYGRGWYTNHPGAWYAAGWASGYAWRAATWGSMGYWFGYPAYYQPMYYDYGNNVTYQDNSVYVNGQNVGTSDEYYNQASQLATAGANADVSDQGGDWMPLGVFALSQSGSDAKDAAATIQLAVNKQGILRGNFTDAKSGQTQVIQGSVDKQTQRVAFTVGDDQTDVYETGLYNLTKDEAPLLRHIGKDDTQQWLMVRLKQPSDDAGSTDNNTPGGSN